ncbi:MAG: hypothetical protein CMC21_04185 [Flavobacteriaceae bacterium]|nr:hypothetical protein [Flavobacteriaceae bacterium]|tara:strand:+ start:4278 stop:4634 length:357 start_codon:yes stop_codon:yes gene_type:complete
MKKILHVLLFLVFISCVNKEFDKPKSINDIDGKWVSEMNDNIFILSVLDKTIKFNEGALIYYKVLENDNYMYVDGFIGTTKLFTGHIQINSKKDRIKINRFDGGAEGIFKRKYPKKTQ